MDAYRILFCFLLLPLLSSSASNDCPTSSCGQSFTGVRFPFRIIDKQPEDCGFPGFNLRCISPTLMLINLPGSGDFAVRSIDYRFQSIKIYDPSNCLPSRISTFDLSNSPFSASNFRSYTLLSCPNGAKLSGYKPIDCISNSSFSILATASKNVVIFMTSNHTGCQITGFLKVPEQDKPNPDRSTSQLDEITLTWRTPDCRTCEAAGVLCGYTSYSKQITTCFYDTKVPPRVNPNPQIVGPQSADSNPPHVGPPESSAIFRIIAFAMAVPAITASLAIACFMCNKDRRNEFIRNRRATNTIVTPAESTARPSVVGLDEATIESYTKVVLGESKRLPGHDDAACPICLAEYHVKETVRCIPECRHCFHAECIDEWLKMNGTCPVCRNSPSDVHVES